MGLMGWFEGMSSMSGNGHGKHEGMKCEYGYGQ